MLWERAGVTRVAEGVLRMQRAGVNAYLLAAPGGLTLIDAGLPGMWRLLLRALGTVGAVPADISAVVLTHGHFDHVGMCDRLGRDHRVPVVVHPEDRALARHPYRYAHEADRWSYPFRHPRAVPGQVRMVATGALWVEGVPAKPRVRPGVALDVPGTPIPVASPGHTAGHCGFHLPDADVVFTGDALVTLDPYSGRVGPRLVARAATADVRENRRRLENLAATGARLVLPGHGAPFVGGIRHAVDLALAEPVA